MNTRTMHRVLAQDIEALEGRILYAQTHNNTRQLVEPMQRKLTELLALFDATRPRDKENG
jgi:antitoxin component of MazEF toxin-antitoxin module